MTDVSLIARNLFRKKLRAALMIVSIMTAFLIFGVLVAFEHAFNAGEDLAAADRLMVVNKINFTQPLPYAYYERVKAVEGVRQVSHANWFGGYYQEPKNFLIVLAVEPESYLKIYDRELDVPDDARRAFLSERTGALVGEALAQDKGWKVGDRLPVSSTIYSQKNGGHVWEMTVVGIAKPAKPHIDSNFIVFHYDYFNETRSFGKDMIGWLVLTTTSPAVNDKVAKTVDAMFANSTAETATDTEKAFNKAFAAQFGNIALIVKLVVGAAFVTILMIVGNTMAMAVRERVREIAVLKTLGFPPARILRLILGESLLLALLGGLPGIGLAALAVAALREKLLNFIPGMVMTPDIAVLAVVLMLGLGLVTGIIPAFSAMRLNIASALGRS
ncbi:MAG: FtsX-like permease family protein [Azospirillum sp.]|nr:FtsX-like permease family protein [Azospirillum sp.]